MARHEIDSDASQVWIEGSSTLHGIHATATGLTGFVDLGLRGSKLQPTPAVTGEVRISVELLRSGNALVDRETRRRIDARRYPEIVGEVTEATIVAPDRLAVTGSIAFRGETCAVAGELTVTRDGATIRIEGEQSFDVRDWGLQPPRVGLLKVSPEVTVRVAITATRA